MNNLISLAFFLSLSGGNGDPRSCVFNVYLNRPCDVGDFCFLWLRPGGELYLQSERGNPESDGDLAKYNSKKRTFLVLVENFADFHATGLVKALDRMRRSAPDNSSTCVFVVFLDDGRK